MGDIDEAENKLNEAKNENKKKNEADKKNESDQSSDSKSIHEFPLINFLDSKVARTKGH